MLLQCISTILSILLLGEGEVGALKEINNQS